MYIFLAGGLDLTLSTSCLLRVRMEASIHCSETQSVHPPVHGALLCTLRMWARLPVHALHATFVPQYQRRQ